MVASKGYNKGCIGTAFTGRMDQEERYSNAAVHVVFLHSKTREDPALRPKARRTEEKSRETNGETSNAFELEERIVEVLLPLVDVHRRAKGICCVEGGA